MEYRRSVSSVLFFGAVAAFAAGCEVPVTPGDVDPGGGGGPQPTSTPTSTPTPTPSSTATPSPTPTATSTPTADTCVSSDPNFQCFGLKLVSYVKTSTGKPTVTQAEAGTLIQQVNDVWRTCKVGFQLEEYRAVDPTTLGLAYGAQSENQLTSIRREFSNSTTFLVAAVGPWSGGTIAWAVLPGGSGPFGLVVDEQYSKNPFTVGHELGHYMGLYHYSNYSNLMNPYIGSDTSDLTTNQCNIARETNEYYWKAMRRY